MFKSFLIPFASVILGLACSVDSHCQTKESYQIFSEAARQESVLFRGRQARQYNFLYNGHCYWSSTEFVAGDVSYNDKIYYGVLLNIDAADNALLTRMSPDMPAIALEMEDVPWCVIGGIRYRNLKMEGYADAEEGLYEVLSDDGEAFRKVSKQLANYIGNKNGDGIGYFDPNYKENVHDYFQPSVRYYVIKDGVLRKVSKKKAMNHASK